MPENSGLLLVQRYAPVRAPAGEYTSSEVLEKYRGFDGVPWPGELVRDVQLTGGLAPFEEAARLSEYVAKIGSTEVDLVYCADKDTFDVDGFEFVGYDVGYYCSEYSHYSIVLNEIVYGTVLQMVQYSKRLNANLLFGTEDDAQQLLTTRDAMLGTEADLERGDEPLYPVRMFALQRGF